MQKEENLKKLKKKKRGDKMKSNKGITLIALVITIIVMLILVVVTIRISTKGGLFDYAGKAARETKDAIADEKDIADGKITIGGVTYNSIEDYINRDKISSVKLKYKVEGSNIMVYLEDSYIDYLETNELEASAGSDSAYTSYITNKIAEKPLEEKEDYIVKVWNKQKGTSYKNIGELIATEYGSQEAFIEAMFPTPTQIKQKQIMKESTVERTAYLTIATEKVIIKKDDSNNSDGKTYEDAINEQYSNLYWSKLSLELPNKETIIIGDRKTYGVTESGKYKFTLTNEMGEISTINVPVTIQKTSTTKFATITECGYSITIPFTEGQTWEALLGDSGVTICGINLRIRPGRVTINGSIMKTGKDGNDLDDVNVTPSDEIEEKRYKKVEIGRN